MSTAGSPMNRPPKQKRRRGSSPAKNVTFEQIPRDLASLVRGIYSRVARRLRVDPSYVSRVARGERHSRTVESALRRELNRIVLHVNQQLKELQAKSPKAKRTAK